MHVLPSPPSAVADHHDGRLSTYVHPHALARQLIGWNLALFQLDAGSFFAQARQRNLPDLTIVQVKANRTIEFNGTSPDRMRTLVFMAESHERLSWFGPSMASNNLLVLPPRAKLGAVIPAGCEIFFITMKESLFNELQIMPGEGPRVMEVLALDRLRALVTDSACSTATDIRHGILTSLNSATPTQPHTPRRRDLALVRAHSLIRDNAADHLTIQDLREAGQVSERTLQYAFVEHFGINPKRYLIVHRLNRARNDLLQSGTNQIKISEAAIRYGFWHMGSFAGDYRKLFGELPSQTPRQLDRPSSRVPHAYAHQDLEASNGIPPGIRGL